ncbi:MAG TPA: D-alanyl-D-alanine carboxypeptidase [Eubacteriaceae bacterium]|nr:D-alanyl-D-alanine carboxypeptidase [Eubacteriaceae bacterium]
MYRKIFFITILIFFLLTNLTFAKELNILSPSAILIESNTGQILYEKNIDERLYPASTTKIMTALLLLEEGNLEKVIEINKDVPDLIEQGSSQIYLIPGELITREQLLFALLIDSANDAAVAIAQDISGTVEKFAEKMNNRAKELGAVNTNFVNPHGLHDNNHYTTARDLSLIAKEAMKNSIFREAISTSRYIIPATNKQETRYLYNTNRLIRNTKYKNYYYEKATGIKTGYTSKAGYSLVGGASDGNIDLISVILNSTVTQVYEDTHTLFDYAFKNFTSQIIINKGDVVKEISLNDKGDTISAIAGDGFEYLCLENQKENIIQRVDLPDKITLPIEKDEVLGTLVFSLGEKEIGSIPLIADKSVEKPSLISTFIKDFSIWQYIGVFIVLFLLYRTYVYFRKKRRRRRRMFG